MILPVATLRKPSKRSLARFTRAMRLLDLEVPLLSCSDTTLEASDGDAEDDYGTVTWIDKHGQEQRSWWPKLIVLTRSAVQDD